MLKSNYLRERQNPDSGLYYGLRGRTEKVNELLARVLGQALVKVENVVDFGCADGKMPVSVLKERLIETGRFDVAIASAFLKHNPRPVYFLQECERILKPGGILLLLDPVPWVVQVGCLIGKFERRYNPSIWARKRLEKLTEPCRDSLIIESYERYWIAPTSRLYELGLERLVPNVAIAIFGLHQAAVIRKIERTAVSPTESCELPGRRVDGK